MTKNPSSTIFVVHVNDPPTAEPILRIRSLHGQVSIQQMPRYTSFVKKPPKHQIADTNELFAEEKPIRWYYLEDGKEIGPMTATELFALCDQDIVISSTLVKRSVGEPSRWISASDVDGMLAKPRDELATFVSDLDREALAGY